MVKRVCTDSRQFLRFFPIQTGLICRILLVLTVVGGFSLPGNLFAQPSEVPPSESTPQAEKGDPEAQEPNPELNEESKAVPRAEKPVEPAKEHPFPPDDKSAERAKAEKKSKIEQPEVVWNDEIAAIAAKKSPEGADDLRSLQKQVQQVVRHSMPATLGVQLGQAAGSAVIVSEDGLVLTAGHVAGVPGREVNCFFSDGSRAKGITLGLNRSIDSGMIRLTEPGPWPHVKLSEDSDLKPGEWVVALGHAGGFDPRRTPPVRIGRVLYQNNEVIHTDCALVGGDSGGPLFNLKGELVGIHSRIGRKVTSNFHVPIATYRDTWDRLVASEAWGGRLNANEPVRYRPSMGLAVQGNDGICRVTQVFPNGPSSNAGVQVGDVILKFGEAPVTSSEELTKLLWKQKPGNKVKVEIERDGEPQTIEVRLGQIALSFPGGPQAPEDEEQEG